MLSIKDKLENFYNLRDNNKNNLLEIRNFINYNYYNIINNILNNYEDIKNDFIVECETTKNQVIFGNVNDEYDELIIESFFSILKKIIDIL